MLSRKWIKFIAFSVFLIFASVDLGENYIHHHHGDIEDSDCSYCSFHKALCNSDFSAAPVDIVPIFFLFFAVLVFLPSYRSTRFSPHSSRAPPVVLS